MMVLALVLQWKLPIGFFLTLLIVGIALIGLLRYFAFIPVRYAMMAMRALVLGCCAGLVLSWALHRTPIPVHRLAVFPLKPLTVEDAPGGAGYGLAQVTTELLRRNLTEDTRICPIDMVEYCDSDSVASRKTAAAAASERLGAQYAVTGTYHYAEDSTLVIQAHFLTFPGATDTRLEIRVSYDSLAVAPYLLAQAIRRSFPAFEAIAVTPLPFTSQAFRQYCRGQALFYQKTPEGFWEASEAFRAALASDSSFVWGYYGLAQVYNAWERPSQNENNAMKRKAVELGQTALILNARLTEVHRLMAQAYQSLRQWDAQSVILKRAINADPMEPWNYTALAWLRRERFQDFGFRDEGELCEQAARLNPDAILLRVQLIYGYVRAGRLTDALTFTNEAMELTPDRGDLLLAAGEAYQYNNRAKPAVDTYSRAIKLAPNDHRGYIGLANAYSLSAKMSLAIETYEQGIRLLPQNAELYYNLGVLYQRHGSWDKALPYFQKAIAVDDHANSHYYLARWYEKNGDRANAVEHWKKRIALGDPYEQWTTEAMAHLRALAPSELPTIGVTQ